MMRDVICWLSLAVAVCLIATDSPKATPRDPTWMGVYSSPSEPFDLNGAVLSVEQPDRPMTPQHFTYRLFMYSDLESADAIPQEELSGDILVEGDRLFLPMASGYHRANQKEPALSASLYRYTRMTIRGRTALLRDDALRHYLEDKSLYQPGILIKIADDATKLSKLADARHESISVLGDPKKEGNK
jgi:hypothetical protein